MTIAQTLKPHGAGLASKVLHEVTLVGFGSAVIALCSQVSFYLPVSPVPVTAQTFAVLVVGFLLGSTRGAVAAFTYLAEGAGGLPVFAGGAAGFVQLAGPTGGYLLGFVPAAWLAGYFAERGWDRNAILTSFGMAAGLTVIYMLGTAWLSLFVGSANAAKMGVYPFLAGDMVKIALAAMLLPSLRKFV